MDASKGHSTFEPVPYSFCTHLLKSNYVDEDASIGRVLPDRPFPPVSGRDLASDYLTV